MKRDLRRIWTRYVLMYVGVAVLVMLLLLPIYHIAYQQTQNIVISETRYALQKNIDTMEIELVSINQYVDSLLSSKEVVHMAYLEDENHYHLMLALALSDDMLKSAAGHVYVDDIVLLFPEGKYVVSRGKVTAGNRYYGSVIGYEHYDRGDLRIYCSGSVCPFFRYRG